MGWSVKVEAISGERQHSKKSWGPFADGQFGRQKQSMPGTAGSTGAD